MKFETKEFTWLRPRRAGAFTVETLPSEDPNRSGKPEVFLVQRTTDFERYRPLAQETALFLNFATTDQTPEAVLQFAQRYGCLEKEARSLSAPGHRESLARWYDAMTRMSGLYAVWELARKADEEALNAWLKEISWRPFAQLLEGVKNPRSRAYRFLADQISFSIRGLTEPRIVWDESMPRLLPKIVPVNLLGAIYLQFAYAVGEDKQYQQCGHCKKWFELAPGLNRADRLFCSDSCRVMAYRARRLRAFQLWAEGKQVREIAKEVGSSVSTVKNWIKKSKD
jgi:hypothetical protein